MSGIERKDITNKKIIRNASLEDLDAIAEVERSCFPIAEAASRDDFAQRLKFYGNHFWLLFDGDRLIAFVDGMVTDQADLTDEMYEKADMHQEDGAWQMIFGVNTIQNTGNADMQGCFLKELLQTQKRREGRDLFSLVRMS